MIVALLIGREGSVGFPKKNVHSVLGRALMEYPLLAVLNSDCVDEVYVSTDSEAIKAIANRHGCKIIDRPAYLCTKEALGEDAFKHGYDSIVEREGTLEFILLLFCNAPMFLPGHIKEGVEMLRRDPSLDSAITVSRYNMFSPVRARRITSNNLVEPFIPFECYKDMTDKAINCDRDSQGDVYFADVCLSICRPRCLEKMELGILPQKWMGRRIAPIINCAGLDIDFEWQLPMVEHWLRKNGFTETATPYD